MPDAMEGTAGVPVAVLIDADNVAADLLDAVLAEAARFGRPTIRRVYGNWTGTELQGWKKLLHEHALQPVQQFAYVPGKNATDTALIIDAMDLLHGNLAHVFCLVSSDSDYTRLAMRLREAGKVVVGMGQQKTPASLVKACDRFVYLDTIKRKPKAPAVDVREVAEPGRRAAPRDGRKREAASASASAAAASAGAAGGGGSNGIPRKVVDLLRDAVEDAQGEDGWADVGGVGNILYANNPDFDPRNYGKRQLATLLESMRDFVVKRPPEGQPGAVLVRLK